MNAARSSAPGGRVFHSPPVSMVNHGYVNVCPALLWDFYSQNGWKVEHLSGFRVRDLGNFDAPGRGRYRVPEESALYFLARRPAEGGTFAWPAQGKYQREVA